MSYEFACGDVVAGCPTTFRADTEAAVLQDVAAHARADHGLTDLPDELVGAVRAAIRTT